MVATGRVLRAVAKAVAQAEEETVEAAVKEVEARAAAVTAAA